MPRLKTLLLFCLWFGIADSAASDVTPPQIDSWALQATPLRAEESLVTADDVLKNFSGLGSIQTAPINNRKQQGFLSSSLISDYKIRLQQDVVNQRLVSYLGITAVNLMSDLEEAVGLVNLKIGSLREVPQQRVLRFVWTAVDTIYPLLGLISLDCRVP